MITRILAAVVFAVVLGNGSVVAFNRTPAGWFADYEEDDPNAGGKSEGGDSARGANGENEASKGGARVKVLPPKLLEADNAGRQRLPSTPWKYAFTGYFGLCGLYLAVRGGSLSFEISVLCVLFVVLEMAIADQLYRIVPDQFGVMLAVTAIAFIGYYDKWWEQLAGAGIGLGVSLAILGLGYLLFRTGSIGGADIKFFTCIGLVTGRTGVVLIYILTTLFFAAYSLLKIAFLGGTIRDKNAMLPSACAATTVYFLFLWNAGDMLVLYL